MGSRSKGVFHQFRMECGCHSFPTKSIHHARNLDGHWYINNRQFGRNNESINIYVVGKSALVDLSVFLTDDEQKIKGIYNEKIWGRKRKKKRDLKPKQE
jgi:hypothetical protein